MKEHEIYLGKCLNDDEFFAKQKEYIIESDYSCPQLVRLAHVMYKHGNTMEAILKNGGRDLVSYAMQIANNQIKKI